MGWKTACCLLPLLLITARGDGGGVAMHGYGGGPGLIQLTGSANRALEHDMHHHSNAGTEYSPGHVRLNSHSHGDQGHDHGHGHVGMEHSVGHVYAGQPVPHDKNTEIRTHVHEGHTHHTDTYQWEKVVKDPTPHHRHKHPYIPEPPKEIAAAPIVDRLCGPEVPVNHGWHEIDDPIEEPLDSGTWICYSRIICDPCFEWHPFNPLVGDFSWNYDVETWLGKSVEEVMTMVTLAARMEIGASDTDVERRMSNIVDGLMTGSLLEEFVTTSRRMSFIENRLLGEDMAGCLDANGNWVGQGAGPVGPFTPSLGADACQFERPPDYWYNFDSLHPYGEYTEDAMERKLGEGLYSDLVKMVKSRMVGSIWDGQNAAIMGACTQMPNAVLIYEEDREICRCECGYEGQPERYPEGGCVPKRCTTVTKNLDNPIRYRDDPDGPVITEWHPEINKIMDTDDKDDPYYFKMTFPYTDPMTGKTYKENPSVGKPCLFPFVHGGVQYNGCAFFGPDGLPIYARKRYCAVAVDYDRIVQEWGLCVHDSCRCLPRAEFECECDSHQGLKAIYDYHWFWQDCVIGCHCAATNNPIDRVAPMHHVMEHEHREHIVRHTDIYQTVKTEEVPRPTISIAPPVYHEVHNYEEVMEPHGPHAIEEVQIHHSHAHTDHGRGYQEVGHVAGGFLYNKEGHKTHSGHDSEGHLHGNLGGGYVGLDRSSISGHYQMGDLADESGMVRSAGGQTGDGHGHGNRVYVSSGLTTGQSSHGHNVNLSGRQQASHGHMSIHAHSPDHRSGQGSFTPNGHRRLHGNDYPENPDTEMTTGPFDHTHGKAAGHLDEGEGHHHDLLRDCGNPDNRLVFQAVDHQECPLVIEDLVPCDQAVSGQFCDGTVMCGKAAQNCIYGDAVFDVFQALVIKPPWMACSNHEQTMLVEEALDFSLEIFPQFYQEDPERLMHYHVWCKKEYYTESKWEETLDIDPAVLFCSADRFSFDGIGDYMIKVEVLDQLQQKSACTITVRVVPGPRCPLCEDPAMEYVMTLYDNWANGYVKYDMTDLIISGFDKLEYTPPEEGFNFYTLECYEKANTMLADNVDMTNCKHPDYRFREGQTFIEVFQHKAGQCPRDLPICHFVVDVRLEEGESSCAAVAAGEAPFPCPLEGDIGNFMLPYGSRYMPLNFIFDGDDWNEHWGNYLDRRGVQDTLMCTQLDNGEECLKDADGYKMTGDSLNGTLYQVDYHTGEHFQKDFHRVHAGPMYWRACSFVFRVGAYACHEHTETEEDQFIGHHADYSGHGLMTGHLHEVAPQFEIVTERHTHLENVADYEHAHEERKHGHFVHYTKPATEHRHHDAAVHTGHTHLDRQVEIFGEVMNGRVQSDVEVDRHHHRSTPAVAAGHFLDEKLGQNLGLYHNVDNAHLQVRGHDGHQAGHSHGMVARGPRGYAFGRRLQDEEAAADAGEELEAYNEEGGDEVEAADAGAETYDAYYEETPMDTEGDVYYDGYEDVLVEELPNYRTDMHFHDWEHGNTYSQKGHEHWEHLQTWDVPCGDENFRATQRAICVSGVISLEDSRCTYRHEHDPEALLTHGHGHGDGWKHNTGYDGLGNGFGHGHQHEHEHVDPIPMTVITDDNDQGTIEQGGAFADGIGGYGNDAPSHAHTGYGYQPVEPVVERTIVDALDDLTAEVYDVEADVEEVEEAVENLEEAVEEEAYYDAEVAEAVETAEE